MAEITFSNVMKAYAQDAEHLASEQGISLDYTEESLERVDLLVHKIAGDTVLTPRTSEEASQLWALVKIYDGVCWPEARRLLSASARPAVKVVRPASGLPIAVQQPGKRRGPAGAAAYGSRLEALAANRSVGEVPIA